MQTIVPSKNNLLCQQEEGTNVTGGFYVTENAYEKPLIATVIAVGSGVQEYKAGDRAIYKQYATTEIKLDDKDYFLIEEGDVLGKVV